MSGLLDLMFGSGASKLLGSSETEESKYAVVQAEKDRESEVKDAEYREVRSLPEKMFGKSFSKRTPEEEKTIQKSKEREERNKELKKAQKKQAEKDRKETFEKAYNEEKVKVQARNKAKREERQAERERKLNPYTKNDWMAPHFFRYSQPALEGRKPKTPGIETQRKGVYPYDLISMGVSNTSVGSIGGLYNPLFAPSGIKSSGGMHGLYNPMFEFGSVRHANGKHKGGHQLASFGFV